jgi:hypothetical protein
MEAMTTVSWTDDRLNDLKTQVDSMQDEMRAEFKAVRKEIKEEAETRRLEIQSMHSDMDRRFDGLQASITTLAVTIFATTTSGFIALFAAMILTR